MRPKFNSIVACVIPSLFNYMLIDNMVLFNNSIDMILFMPGLLFGLCFSITNLKKKFIIPFTILSTIIYYFAIVIFLNISNNTPNIFLLTCTYIVPGMFGAFMLSKCLLFMKEIKFNIRFEIINLMIGGIASIIFLTLYCYESNDFIQLILSYIIWQLSVGITLHMYIKMSHEKNLKLNKF